MISGKSATALLACLLLFQADDLEALKKKFELEKSKEAGERQATIAALGRLRTAEAADFLYGVFEKHRDQGVAKAITQALGTCNTPNALKYLLAIAERTYFSNNERGWALDAALAAGSDDAATMAGAILAGKTEPNRLRESAGRSLLKHGAIGKTEKIWRKVLSDESADIRALALRALAPLKEPQVLSLARTALLDPKQASQVRCAAVEPWRVKGGAAAARLLLDAPLNEDGDLRTAIIGSLTRLLDDDAFEAVAGEIARAAPPMKSLAAWALGGSKNPKSLPILQKMFADGALEVRIAAMEAAATRGSDEVCTLLKAAAQRGEDEASETAVSLLSQFPYPDTVELLVQLAGTARTMPYRIAVIDALSRCDRPEAFPVFETGLASKEWPIRAASIRGLSRMKRPESVDLLVDRMALEDGRLLGDLVAALKSLTRKSMGYNPDHWKAWWKVNRDKFSFDNPKADADGGVRGTTTYHDIPVLSKRINFLLDVSGSMREKRGETTRLAEAKAELAKVLTALAKDAKVNMIFFNGRVDAWQARLVPIGPNLAKAQEAVNKLVAEGQTNIYDSLERALRDPEADTIFLLSDGSPSVGTFTSREDVLREVRRLNRARQVAIHTISLGKSDLLKQLAADNGGQYEEIK